jgi:hypothetical protein
MKRQCTAQAYQQASQNLNPPVADVFAKARPLRVGAQQVIQGHLMCTHLASQIQRVEHDDNGQRQGEGKQGCPHPVSEPSRISIAVALTMAV